MTRNYRTSGQETAARRRKMLTGLTVGLLSVSAFGVATISVKAGSSTAQADTISAISHSSARSSQAQAGATGTGHAGHQGHATPTPPPPLEILANNCDKSKLQLHDGFQAGNRCVTTEFGEVGETAKNPTLIISAAPKRVRAGQPFQIKVSTRNLVRDRFLAAAQGGYYKESSLLNEESLQRGHFHTACRMLDSKTLAPDPSPGSVFFKATEDGGGTDKPDVVTVEVAAGLPSRGLAECAAWAGDGSHRIPMMESVQAIPAFDTVRIWVR